MMQEFVENFGMLSFVENRMVMDEQPVVGIESLINRTLSMVYMGPGTGGNKKKNQNDKFKAQPSSDRILLPCH